MDYSLRGEILLTCLKEFSQIAESCLRSRRKERPTMAEVVVRLDSALALQERPYFSGPAYSTTPARKISFIRKILKFFFPSTVHDDAIPSRKNGNKERTSNRAFSSKDLTVNENDVSPKIPQGAQIVIPNLKLFRFAELKDATRNFRQDMVCGVGSLGQVYKGWFDKDTYAPSKVGTGICVAIKERHNVQGNAEWQAELNFLGKFDHSNFVHLLGYCLEDQKYLLVYEFMVKGSFDTHLFRRSPYSLPWALRLKIMIGAARGLVFLHTMDKQVIHRNFKSSSILLDGDYNPKLSGFGLATCGPDSDDDKTHVTTRVIGTSGYAAPEYVLTGHLSVKTDVYGFGVVLLEVLTGRRVLDASRPMGERNLLEWARPHLTNQRRLRRILDPRLEGTYPMKGAMVAAKLVYTCTESSPKERPAMNQVLQTLQQIRAIKIKTVAEGSRTVARSKETNPGQSSS